MQNIIEELSIYVKNSSKRSAKTLLDNFEIFNENIGKGSFSVVKLAKEKLTQKNFAMKIVK